MSASQIVEWKPEHLRQVIDLIGRVLRDQKVIPDSDQPIDDDDLLHIAENYTGRSRFWVFLQSDTVIGTVAIREMNATTAKLKCMFVQTAHHGQGIGQTLFDHALAFARSQNYTAIILNTDQRMKRAHRFYERNGFQRVSEEREQYTYRRDL